MWMYVDLLVCLFSVKTSNIGKAREAHGNHQAKDSNSALN